jgi:hypothetical protein
MNVVIGEDCWDFWSSSCYQKPMHADKVTELAKEGENPVQEQFILHLGVLRLGFQWGEGRQTITTGYLLKVKSVRNKKRLREHFWGCHLVTFSSLDPIGTQLSHLYYYLVMCRISFLRNLKTKRKVLSIIVLCVLWQSTKTWTYNFNSIWDAENNTI